MREELYKIELAVLLEIANTIADSRSDIIKSLEKALLVLHDNLQLENCVIYRLEEEILNIYASINFNKHQKIISQYRLGEGATGVATKAKEPVVIENIHNDMLFLNKSGNRTREMISYIAVPMIVDNKVIGVLASHLSRATQIDFEETVRILTIVSSLVAQAINSYLVIERIFPSNYPSKALSMGNA